MTRGGRMVQPDFCEVLGRPRDREKADVAKDKAKKISRGSEMEARAQKLISRLGTRRSRDVTGNGHQMIRGSVSLAHVGGVSSSEQAQANRLIRPRAHRELRSAPDISVAASPLIPLCWGPAFDARSGSGTPKSAPAP